MERSAVRAPALAIKEDARSLLDTNFTVNGKLKTCTPGDTILLEVRDRHSGGAITLLGVDGSGFVLV